MPDKTNIPKISFNQCNFFTLFSIINNMKKLFYALIFFSFVSISTQAQEMDFKNLKLTLAQRAQVIEEDNNVIQYELDGLRIYLITDENANRMRLMSPVQEESKLTSDDLTTLMKANYDRALDAKYAISNGILWSVYAHPLKELTKEQLIDALYQVKNLVNNYGTTYTSTDFVFGGDGE